MTTYPIYDSDSRQWFVHDERHPDDLSNGYDCRADAEAACEEREDDGK